MITTIQGLIVILFFIVPGFTVVEVSHIISPVRKGSSFDKSILSIIWSTLIHLPATLFVIIILWVNGAKLSNTFTSIQNNIGEVSFYLLCYFIFVACIIAPIIGYAFPKYKKYLLKRILREKMNILQATSVWDYVKTEIRPSINNAIRAKFNMKSGIKYYGDIVGMPAIIDDDKPYDIFIQKVKRVSKLGVEERLDGINGMMLNSANIDSIEIKFVTPEISI